MCAKKKTTAALSSKESGALLSILQQRFEKNTSRHQGVDWKSVEQRLQSNPHGLSVLQEMEDTGGEPDVVAFDKKTGAVTFFDCAAETPAGRRSLCYDLEAWESRKEHRPSGNAMDMAGQMGIEMLDEEEYKFLQQLGKFDLKTSSWLKTPDAMRKLGGAIFGDCRFNRVFICHNGVQSYYAARGFRGKLVI